jgi:hypothetical protein
MCKVLRIARSTYYYESTRTSDETELEDTVEAVFNQNRKVYGSRKIKVTRTPGHNPLPSEDQQNYEKEKSLFSIQYL